MTTRRENGEGTAPRQRSDGRWEIKLRHTNPITGKPERRSVYGKTKTEVRNRAKKVVERIEAGNPAQDSSMTLATWAQRWIATTLVASGGADSTKDGYVYALTKHIVESDNDVAKLSLARIRASDINGWIAALRQHDRHYEESTLLKYFRALARCLDGAITDGLITKNPCDDAEQPGTGKSEVTIFEDSELAAFMQIAQTDTLAALWETLRSTGMRGGEALALEWPDIDLIGREWTDKDLGNPIIKIRRTVTRTRNGIDVGATKTTASSRDIVATTVLAEALRKHRVKQLRARLASGGTWDNTADRIFTTATGKLINPRNMLRSFRRISKKAGIKNYVVPHSFRHTLATSLLDRGIHHRAVSEFLGHSNPAITLRTYAHVTNRAKADTIAALEDVVRQGTPSTTPHIDYGA